MFEVKCTIIFSFSTYSHKKTNSEVLHFVNDQMINDFVCRKNTYNMNNPKKIKNLFWLKTFAINYCSVIYKYFTFINKTFKKEQKDDKKETQGT